MGRDPGRRVQRGYRGACAPGDRAHRERHAGGRVVCFAHGGTIGTVLALATGSRPFAFIGSDNGAISSIVVAGPRWWLRGFNDRSHLERHSPRVRSV